MEFKIKHFLHRIKVISIIISLMLSCGVKLALYNDLVIHFLSHE